MNHQEANGLIRLIANAWPTVPFRADDQREMVVAWQMVLRDISLDEAQAVVVDYSRRGDQFPPAPGAIAKHVLDARDRASGAGAPDVDQAFTEVMNGVRQRGLPWGPPEWSHPAIAAVVQAISWRELCESTNPEAMRAHFFKLYEVGARRDTNDRRSVLTNGLPAAFNQAVGQLQPGNTDDL